ncbi:unnamed protein product [Candidula unifasciata]|uniref:Ig-like domain-containing protein n=1 Tax=Candidula unifasciata TaxID=100452 RepID=A0A8S3YP86_9EUPU|nr:unnamed protein product [Candidula unifasciata]
MIVVREAVTQTTPVPVQLDPELRKQVEWFLQRMMQSFSKRVGETVSLICGHALTVSVVDSLPGAMLSWFLNDDPLEMDPSRVLYNKGNIDITDLTPVDTGVYTCQVEWGPEKARDNITVGVYSLVVTADNPTRYVFESDGMQLFSNSVPLGELFPAATRQWLYNNTNGTSLMPTLASNISVDVVPRVDKSMAGVWTCRVDDLATMRNWTTAWFRLGVQDAPSFIARTYRVLSDHVYVVIVVSSIVVVLLCIFFIYGVRLMKQKEDETDEEFLKTRNGWEEKFSTFGAGGKVKVSEADLPPKKPDEEEGEATKVPEGKRLDTDISSAEDTEGKGIEEDGKVNLLSEAEQNKEDRDIVPSKDIDKGEEFDEGKEFDEKKVEDISDSETDIGNQEVIVDIEADVGDRETHVRSKETDNGDREAHVGDRQADDGDREAHVGDRQADDGDREAHVGDGEDGGDESDTNKSATLSRKKSGRRKHTVKWQSKDKRRNAGLTGNDENISNVQRHAIPGDRMTIRMSERPERRKRKDGKRKKHKGNIIYPEVSKDSALNWLLQNSPQLRKYKSVLQDTGNRTPAVAQYRNEPVRSRQVAMEAHRGGSNRTTSAPTSSNTQVYLWRMPEFSPADVRNWLTRGRERMSGWTAKPSSWGHSDIRYTVLPQGDDDDDDFL